MIKILDIQVENNVDNDRIIEKILIPTQEFLGFFNEIRNVYSEVVVKVFQHKQDVKAHYSEFNQVFCFTEYVMENNEIDGIVYNLTNNINDEQASNVRYLIKSHFSNVYHLRDTDFYDINIVEIFSEIERLLTIRKKFILFEVELKEKINDEFLEEELIQLKKIILGQLIYVLTINLI